MSHQTSDATISGFMFSVLDHWIVLMSGGLVTVGVGVYEKLSSNQVPIWLYITVLLSFVIVGCYFAWRDERRNRISAESLHLGRPLLRTFIKLLNSSDWLQEVKDPEGNHFHKVVGVNIRVTLGILNASDIPTTITGLGLHVHTPTGDAATLGPTFDEPYNPRNELRRLLVSNEPLTQGKQVQGEILFRIPELRLVDVNHDDAKFILTVRDAWEHEHPSDSWATSSALIESAAQQER